MFIDYIWFQVMTKHLNGIFNLNMFSTVILPSQLDDILLMAKVIPPLYPLLPHPPPLPCHCSFSFSTTALESRGPKILIEYFPLISLREKLLSMPLQLDIL